MAFDPITGIAEAVSGISDLIGRFIPDPAKAAELASQLEKMKSDERTAQMAVNQAEASNPAVFVAGWRPGAGWMCVAGLGYIFLVQPLLAWGSMIFKLPVPPTIDADLFQWLIGGMLGLGGWRSLDKIKDVATNGVSRR